MRRKNAPKQQENICGAILEIPFSYDSSTSVSPFFFFPVSRGPGDPPDGQGEMERSGGPHSDSGSISPIWERDRRGPPPAPSGLLGPPGVWTIKY